ADVVPAHVAAELRVALYCGPVDVEVRDARLRGRRGGQGERDGRGQRSEQGLLDHGCLLWLRGADHRAPVRSAPVKSAPRSSAPKNSAQYRLASRNDAYVMLAPSKFAPSRSAR